MHENAVRPHGRDADRRLVEIGDRVLRGEEGGLLLAPVARHVLDGPGDEIALALGQRGGAGGHAQPAPVGRADLLGDGIAAPRGVAQARQRRAGIAGRVDGEVGNGHRGSVAVGAHELGVAAGGEQHLAVAARHQHAAIAVAQQHLGDRLPGRAPADPHDAEHETEEEGRAGGGEQAEHDQRGGGRNGAAE